MLKIDVTSSEYIRIRNVIQSFYENKDQYSYNLLGLIGVAIQYPIHQKNKYFCSQFVAEVFEQSGLSFWDLPPLLISPNDFLKHSRFELVYEGSLYNYPLLDQGLLSVAPPSFDYLWLKKKLTL